MPKLMQRALALSILTIRIRKYQTVQYHSLLQNIILMEIASSRQLLLSTAAKTLKSGTDYTVTYKNNLNAGTGSVVITGKGAYSGTVTKTFTIAKRSVANCHIDFDAVHYFANARIKPAVKVSINGADVYSGNYTVSYSNNIASGAATITIKGKNNLSGTVTKKFAILPKSISKFTIITSTNSANKYQPKVTVKAKASDSSAVYNGNYTVSYKKLSNTQVQITVTGKNSLRGTKTIKVNV